MAKTQTTAADVQNDATVPAYRIALAAAILEEEVASAHELQNYAYGLNPRVHIALATNGSSWSWPTHEIEFPESTSFSTYFNFRTYIDPDTVQIRIEAVASFTSTNDGECRVTIGATNTTLAFTAGASGDNQTATLNTSSTGTGERTITVELRQVGASQPTGQTLDYLVIQDQPVTSSLPDPDTSE